VKNLRHLNGRQGQLCDNALAADQDGEMTHSTLMLVGILLLLASIAIAGGG
jgi:hypothetical protein